MLYRLGHQVRRRISSSDPRSNGSRTTCSGIQKHAGGGTAFELDFEKRPPRLGAGHEPPENLSRAFKGLQPYGVTVTGTRITIGNQGDLERFAKPNPLI